jgi:hypothetical protein
MGELAHSFPPSNPPALIAAAGNSSRRFLEFFAANIRNPYTGRAYGRYPGD